MLVPLYSSSAGEIWCKVGVGSHTQGKRKPALPPPYVESYRYRKYYRKEEYSGREDIKEPHQRRLAPERALKRAQLEVFEIQRFGAEKSRLPA